MSPKKLTNEDKKEILKLYRETGETTSTLAERFEVSSSTISRFLKSSLSESEYDDLIQQKRLARTAKGALLLELEKIQQETQDTTPKKVKSPVSKEKEKTEEKQESVAKKPQLVQKEAVESQTEKTEETQEAVTESQQESEVTSKPVRKTTKPILVSASPEDDEDDEIDKVDVKVLGEMLGEDLDDEDELDDEEEEDWEDETDLEYQAPVAKTVQLQVLPLETAALPSICYLVIDRGAELITRPLKEFADLGKIPAEEVQQKTLPVFDNHRVARRFSKRRERVIKVPDGRMLQKASPYLEAKGITRLLLDGQIYSL